MRVNVIGRAGRQSQLTEMTEVGVAQYVIQVCEIETYRSLS